MELSVIVFCYNEEKNIGRVLEQAIRFLNQERFANSEIIVVNDGSTDRTAEWIDTYVGKYPELRIKHLAENKGIGQALNQGYDMAQKEYVCAIPGDGQFDIFELNNIPEFGKNEFVTFYRKEKNYNLYRSLLTSFNQYFNKWLLHLDVPDVNWVKVYRKEQIQKKYRHLESSLVESEICGKLIKSGVKHIDLPSQYHARRYGTAKGGNWRTLKLALSEMGHLFLKIKRFPVTS